MDLPDEILFMICDNIDSQRDRIRLLSVCRRWYRLFFSRVYACITIEEDFDEFGGVARLASALLHNPHLASAIREFNTGRWGLCGNGYNKDFDTTPFQPLLEQISDSPEELANWKKQLDSNDDDVWLPIILLLMKNLRVLKIEFMWSFNDFLERVMTRNLTRQKPFDTNPALQHLEEFYIYNDSLKDSYFAAYLMPFFRLPSMKVFNAHSLWEDEEHRPLPADLKPPPASSDIVELRFIGDTYTRCNGSEGFATFITACKNLQIFEYQHDDCAVWADRYIVFRAHAFYQPLTRQKHSLRVLRLSDIGDIEPIDDDSYGPGQADQILKDGGHPSDEWFGSLAEFMALRELRIRLRNLLDFGVMSKTPTVTFNEILPPTLEYLCIADYQTKDFSVLMTNLQAMLTCREDKFPVLRKLEIQPHDLDDILSGSTRHFEIPASVRESFVPVQDTCEKAGIEFSFSLDGEDRLTR